MKLPSIYSSALALLSPLVSGQEIKLLPSDGAANDNFGHSVDIAEDIAIVGARFSMNTGAAYLFNTSSGEQVARLSANDGGIGDQFGEAVAISGTIAIVGSPFSDGLFDNSGAAYLFNLSNGSEFAKLVANEPFTGDRLGRSVSLSNTTAIVGAFLDDELGIDAGAAYLFSTSTGIQLFKLTAQDGWTSDWFGFSVGISEDLALIGSPKNDDNGYDSGCAYVFDSNNGTQLRKLLASDGSADATFGYSVCLDEDIALVGAPNFGFAPGAAYVFNALTGEQLLKLSPSDGVPNDGFGYSVQLFDTYAIIGANLTDEQGANSGSVYLFDLSTGAEIDKIIPSDGSQGDQFGWSVAIAAGNAIIGTPEDDDNGYTGSAYIFPIDCNNNGIVDCLEISADRSLDCDNSGRLDSCELIWMDRDCNLNGIYDPCECLNETTYDCNNNLIPDLCEGLPDCDSNGTPDECESDCNNNGLPDDCEALVECNANGIPDECEEDCNANGTPDDCDLANANSVDCNRNGIPDECETAGNTPDCNTNGIPDLCEINDNTEPDLNANGIPDSCECLATNYCTANSNTAGSGVQISIIGIPSVALNSLSLDALGGPSNQPGLFFHGPGTANQPFGEGIRCVSAPIIRVAPPVFFNSTGAASKQLDMNSTALSSIQPADTRYFQLWYRDPQGGPFGFNLSNGLEITFCP